MVAIDNFTSSGGLSQSCLAISPTVVKWFLARSRFWQRKRLRNVSISPKVLVPRVISILDEVIALIRASETKQGKISRLAMNLRKRTGWYVLLQLYRLAQYRCVVVLQEGKRTRWGKIAILRRIGDERTMYNLMEKELREVKKKFATHAWVL